MHKLIKLICNPQKGPVAKLCGLANIADDWQLEKNVIEMMNGQWKLDNSILAGEIGTQITLGHFKSNLK